MKDSFKNTLKKSVVFLIIYTIVFSLCALAVFSCFLIFDKTLISSDGLRQHYVAFVYFGKYVREIIKGVFVSKTLTVPSFSFGIGYGGDILQTLNYYVIGDPLNLISVFTPVRYAYYAYTFLILFRLWLAGVSFALFCRYKRVGSRAGIIAGAICYVFAAYSLNFGTMHPFFLNPLIYLPLLLIGVDLIIEGKRPYLLVIMVFLSAVSNFYFFYMLAVVTAVYALLRLAVIYKKDLKNILKKLVAVAIPAAVGVVMSSAVLVPVAYAFLSDTRGGSNASLSVLYAIGVYLRFPSSLIITNSVLGASQTLLGYSSVSVVAVTILFTKKGKGVTEKLLFVIATVLILIPITAVVMNGFSYPANRWIWAYSLIVSYILASNWGYMMTLNQKQKLIISIVSAVYTLFVIITRHDIIIDVMFACAGMLVFSLVLSTDIKRSVKSAVCILLSVLTVCANGMFYYGSDSNYAFIDKFADKEHIKNEFTDTLGKAVRNVSEDKSFYRYTHDFESTDYNKDLIFNTRSTSFYWSIQNPNVSQFLTEMELPYSYIYQYQNLDKRTQLNSLLGVKYYCAKFKGRLPYGYKLVENDVLDEYSVYKNTRSLPLIYSYTDYITREQYDSLNAVYKQNALMQHILLEDDLEGYSKSEPDQTSQSLKYTVYVQDGIEINGDEVTVTDTTSNILLTFDGVENSETYIRFKNNGVSSDIRQYTLTFTPYIDDRNQNKTTVKPLNLNDLRYDGREYYSVCLGYREEAMSSLKIEFSDVGTYKLSELQIICQPLDDFSNQVDKLKGAQVSEIKAKTDKITAKVSADEDRILCLSIPYSAGWSAYVDGEETEILQANTMMCAIPVSAGEHDIKLTYKTPYLNYGLLLSAVGFAGFALVIVISEKKRK